jgi:hypothetical protein
MLLKTQAQLSRNTLELSQNAHLMDESFKMNVVWWNLRCHVDKIMQHSWTHPSNCWLFYIHHLHIETKPGQLNSFRCQALVFLLNMLILVKFFNAFQQSLKSPNRIPDVMSRFIKFEKHVGEISKNGNHEVIFRLIFQNFVSRIVCQSVISIGKNELRTDTDMMLLERIYKGIGSEFIRDCNQKLKKKLEVNFFLLQIIER